MPDVLWVDDKGRTSVREVDEDGKLIEPVKPEPFGGKGDHDGNGKVGGAAPALSPRRGRKQR